ncbi:hypothetical protein KC19_5G143200 [Ceratodon purpureus]|uniref:Protein kinase domain-containing protein n=1 Tax=Ceratodon purpureus TaxID=3225 RepID=A0A8T0I3T2_CERPU|nr:hypothetical protein KC19_5G143200 [Ceratodon purpureus]
MWHIAIGMRDVQNHNILHRDLKAANVLTEQNSRWRHLDCLETNLNRLDCTLIRLASRLSCH